VNVLVAVFTLLLLGAVMLVLSAPLRAARRREEPRSSAAQEELEAAREAKYREIRDAELDFRTGKLSHEDYAAVEATLRAEALDILNRLSALDGDDEGGNDEGGGEGGEEDGLKPRDA
jgi:hypothetical protein